MSTRLTAGSLDGRGTPALSTAVRLHGDRFVKAEAARAAGERAEAAAEAQAARRAERLPAYRAFLLARERELRERRPEDFAAFERWRGQARARHEAVTGPRRAELLAEWADERRRLRDLRSFFEELPTFEAWDAADG